MGGKSYHVLDRICFFCVIDRGLGVLSGSWCVLLGAPLTMSRLSSLFQVDESSVRVLGGVVVPCDRVTIWFFLFFYFMLLDLTASGTQYYVFVRLPFLFLINIPIIVSIKKCFLIERKQTNYVI